jgi:hypothetical protein
VAGLGTIAVLVTLAVTSPAGRVGPLGGTGSGPGSSTQDDAGPDGPGMAAVHSMPADPTTTSADGSTSSSSSTGSRSGSSSSSSTATVPSPAVVVEAETGTRTGSAQVTADPSASGGAYVTGVGYGGESQPDPPGTLTITGVNLPSTGLWRLTIYFLLPGTKGPRHATVAVSGADPSSLLFAGSPACCGTRTLDLTLAAGPHTVEISNPTDLAPAIDRLTFTAVPAT